jgi:cell division protein FtsB
MTNGLRNRYHQVTEQKRAEVGQVKRLKSENKQLKAHIDYQKDTEWNMKKEQIKFDR